MAVEAIQAEDCIIESEIICVEMAQMVEMLDEEDWKIYCFFLRKLNISKFLQNYRLGEHIKCGYKIFNIMVPSL